jgi:hypothetical protein
VKPFGADVVVGEMWCWRKLEKYGEDKLERSYEK